VPADLNSSSCRGKHAHPRQPVSTPAKNICSWDMFTSQTSPSIVSQYASGFEDTSPC
jgi:hypothetical protein